MIIPVEHTRPARRTRWRAVLVLPATCAVAPHGSSSNSGTFALVLLYLSSPKACHAMSTEIDWQADRERVFSPDFQTMDARGDDGALDAAKAYYTTIDPPVAALWILAAIIFSVGRIPAINSERVADADA